MLEICRGCCKSRLFTTFAIVPVIYNSELNNGLLNMQFNTLIICIMLLQKG